jgi:hypothetical protein
MLLVLIIASMRFIDKSSDMFYNIHCIVVVHSLTFIVVVHSMLLCLSTPMITQSLQSLLVSLYGNRTLLTMVISVSAKFGSVACLETERRS